MNKTQTVSIPVDDELFRHLATMARVASTYEHRAIPLAELCRKMLMVQSDYGKVRFSACELSDVEQEAVKGLDSIRG